MEEIPKEVQEELRQFQVASQQLQLISAQKIQSDMQMKELKTALEELRKAKAGTDVFKSVGRILVKTDISDLKKDLSEESETLDVRIKSLEKQETRLKEKVVDMQKSLQEKLPTPSQG